MYRAAVNCFARARARLPVVSGSGCLASGSRVWWPDEVVEQLELGTDDPRPGWREAEGAVDRAVARFGRPRCGRLRCWNARKGLISS